MSGRDVTINQILLWNMDIPSSAKSCAPVTAEQSLDSALSPVIQSSEEHYTTGRNASANAEVQGPDLTLPT